MLKADIFQDYGAMYRKLTRTNYKILYLKKRGLKEYT